jgi:amphi-Trp domain-containing protein
MARAPEQSEFSHHSLEDKNRVVEYLETLASGLRNGTLALKAGSDALALAPQGLVEFELQASKRYRRTRLSVTLGWTEKDDEAETPVLDLSAGG